MLPNGRLESALARESAMLNIFGSSKKLCDKVSRREALQVGALGIGGLTLADVLRAEAVSGQRSHKAIIMIYMCGAPSHQDMYDLKMDAPSEIRGEFRPVPTNVSGIEICEHMPRVAANMDTVSYTHLTLPTICSV